MSDLIGSTLTFSIMTKIRFVDEEPACHIYTSGTIASIRNNPKELTVYYRGKAGRHVRGNLGLILIDAV